MIEFKNVQKTYPNGTTALSNINLKIEQGEFVAVIGLSGAGKSTLIRCINRMHDITDGQLLVDHVDVSKLRGKQIRRFRRRIGMIFQSFNLVNRISVINNVLVSFVPDLSLWRKLTGIFTKEQKLLALEALDKVGILDKAYIRVDQLSGGQQQRVALARTLAQNPDIILADEPIASLDPVTSKIVMEDFKRINQTMKISVIMNIHHVEVALEYANRIIGVRAGEIVFDGAPAEVSKRVLNNIYGNVSDSEENNEEVASTLEVVSGHV
ncbi:phosphonate ABC transporter ATP-binding protein [Paenibacillus polygoni]|uniref:Phosphonate ABC transporter ATP-binding protein n=1 Tax=Paenibacillus polygoni TaxID=3050112 RepID=A0ABY8X9E9_9BACL|nr:phosphonate ABC transporter ATP-binding protein [Paenibacillus polygoni]WIV21329.1 phosphonate ABC transporter ATP-binding protein [Paenibacillus polygoni]